MKSINQYITEFVNINNVKKREYKYHPKTRDELIENIKTELDKSNTDLNCIDTSDITNMRLLFDQEDGIKLTDNQQKKLDVSYWNMYNVTDTYCMFYKCKYFNCDLSDWDVSHVENMTSMFANCRNFNSDLSKWNVSNVEYMNETFWGCDQFNCDLSKWDVSNVEYMSNMFYDSGLEGNEPKWYKK